MQDINQLISEASALVEELLASAQADLAKSEKYMKKMYKDDEKDDKKEDAKDEDKKEDKKEDDKELEKDEEERSHYEDQAPEADKPAAVAAPEAPAAEEEPADLAAIVKELDLDTLKELHEQIKLELMSRMSPDADKAPEEKPEAQPEAQPEELKMSEKLQAELKAKDAKIVELTQSMNELLGLVETLAQRPIQRAVSDVAYVARGESGKLSKSESKKDLRKSVIDLMGDTDRLAKLEPSEVEILLDVYAGSQAKGLESKALAVIEKAYK